MKNTQLSQATIQKSGRGVSGHKHGLLWQAPGTCPIKTVDFNWWMGLVKSRLSEKYPAKRCEILLFCVSHIQTINVSCLKSEAEAVGKPRKSWQSVRLCLWQQSKETVNPALQLLPPAETARPRIAKHGLVSAHSVCLHLFEKNSDGLTRYLQALHWIRSCLSSEWKYKGGGNSYKVYLQSL